MPRPAIIRRSLTILVAALIAAPIVSVLVDPRPLPTLPAGTSIVLLLPGLLFLAGCFSVYFVLLQLTYKGRNWARWVLAAFTSVGLSTYVPDQVKDLSVVPWVAALNLVIAGAELVAISMLFSPTANPWYRYIRSGTNVA